MTRDVAVTDALGHVATWTILDDDIVDGLQTDISGLRAALAAEVVARQAEATTRLAADNLLLQARIAAGRPDIEVADARGGYPTLGEKVRGAVFDARDYWHAADTDWAPALQRANDAAAVAGGTVIAAAGILDLAARVVFSDGVALRGSLGGALIKGTVFRCTTAAAGFSFGARTTGSWGASASNFLMDGNAVAINPLYIGLGSNATILRVFAMGGAAGGSNVLIESAQNFQWIGGLIQFGAGDGLVLDSGAGGMIFSGLGINANGGQNLVIRESYGDQGYTKPSHITFDHCVIERNHPTVGSAWPRVLVSHGEVIRFRDCAIEGAVIAGATVQPIIEMGLSGSFPDVMFDGGRIIGGKTGGGIGGTTAIKLVTGTLTLADRVEIMGHENGIEIPASGSHIHVLAVNWNNVTTRYSGTGAEDTIARRVELEGTSVVRPNATDAILTAALEADNGCRLVVYANGSIGWASGASYQPDAFLGRNGSYMYLSGNFCVSGEIGFFKYGTTSKQTVSGSRGGNAALASLLTALAAYGLITDSTTA